MSDDVHNRLRQARLTKGLSLKEAAAALGLAYQTAAAHENGNRGPGREIQRYAELYGVSVDWLLTGREMPDVLDRVLAAGLVHEATIPAALKRPKPNAGQPGPFQQFSQTESVPLLGQSVGGPNGRFILNGQQVGSVFCPPGLEGVDGAYAVLVYGTSMEPKFEAGETIWLNPQAPIRKGDYVVAQIATDDDNVHESYIKQFVSRSAARLRLSQFNPDEGEDKDLEFDASDVISVHKIVFHAMV